MAHSTSCIVCCFPFGPDRLECCTPCNHEGVCSLCYLRLRLLMGEYSCVLCKTNMDQVMACKPEDVRPWADLSIWGNDAGPENVWHEESRMFMPKAYKTWFVNEVQGAGCGVKDCNAKPRNIQQLTKHLRDVHQRTLCGVCVKFKKVFLSEQERFTRRGLEVHITKGNPKVGFYGHPQCEFCKTRFYDKQGLFEHLTKDHYSCHLCEQNGHHHKYYRDYSDLERHFRADHWLCEDADCLAKKFVVFKNEIDLKVHQMEHHPHMASALNRTVQVNFRVRRSGEQDESAEQEAEDARQQQEENNEWTVSPPRSPTAGAAAAVADGDGGDGEGTGVDDFPSLATGAARQIAQWARAAQQPDLKSKEEDFPELPTASAKSLEKAMAAPPSYRAAVKPLPSRAMLLAGNDEDRWSYTVPPEATLAGRMGNMKIKVKKKKEKKKKKDEVVAKEEVQQVQQVQQVQDVQEKEATAEQKTGVIEAIQEAIGQDQFQVLKEISGRYRQEEDMSAEEYFAQAKAILPAHNFVELFVGLVNMLPEEGKRQQLKELLQGEVVATGGRSDVARVAPPTAPAAPAAPFVAVTAKKKNKKRPAAGPSTGIGSAAAMMSSVSRRGPIVGSKRTGLSIVKAAPGGQRDGKVAPGGQGDGRQDLAPPPGMMLRRKENGGLGGAGGGALSSPSPPPPAPPPPTAHQQLPNGAADFPALPQAPPGFAAKTGGGGQAVAAQAKTNKKKKNSKQSARDLGGLLFS